MTKEELIALADERGVKINVRDKKAVIADQLGVEIDDEPDADEPASLAPGEAKIRVLKLGDGKVSTGRDDVFGSGVVFGRARKGDFLTVAQSVAEALEAKGYAEIV